MALEIFERDNPWHDFIKIHKLNYDLFKCTVMEQTVPSVVYLSRSETEHLRDWLTEALDDPLA